MTHEGEKLTGRRRFRAGTAGLFRRPVLILQVEATAQHTTNIGGYIDVDVVGYWRDARTTDLEPQERTA